MTLRTTRRRVWTGLAAMAMALAGASAARAATPVQVENADGKTVLEMDDPVLGNAYQEVDVGGKKVLYVEGQNILGPDKTPVLVVDGDDVRPAGVTDVILARFDGSDLRHGKAADAKVLMNYSHPDLCPTAAANRVYRVNGPALNHAQLIAALYALQPDLFKLTDAETAAQKAAYAAAGAESDKAAAADHVAGKWMVLNGHGPVAKINQGLVTFAAKKGGAYVAAMDYTKDGGPTFGGVAVAGPAVSDEQPLWVAFGTPKTVGLCVYTIAGGKLTGQWHSAYDDGDPAKLGTEELKGGDTLGGDYQIVSATAPMTGVAYTGTVTIKPLDVTGAGDDEKPFAVTWTIGTAKVQGIGIRTGDKLYVASGTGADVAVAKLTLHNGSMNGDFVKLGSADLGGMAATSMAE